MTPERYKHELREFLAKHPPANGMITDADHRQPPISAEVLGG